MHWLFLTAAILCEVAATALLKASAGFTKPWPTVGMIAGYALSFYLLSFALRSLTIGTTYAIWSAAGTVLTRGHRSLGVQRKTYRPPTDRNCCDDCRRRPHQHG